MQMLDGSHMSVWKWLVSFPFVLIVEILHERKAHEHTRQGISA